MASDKQVVVKALFVLNAPFQAHIAGKKKGNTSQSRA
jgi:hypothetical protein